MAVDDDQPGITAYHGSPHEFDKFDSSKIGTGEGAQAYGHGLYFAEHEPVAKSYKDNLTGKPTEVQFPNGDTDDFGKPLRWHPDSLDDETEAAAARAVLSYSGSLGQKQVIRQHLDNSKDAANAMRIIKNKEIYPADPGYMYKVIINAHPDHFLDWDKPLSEQHLNVQNAIKHSFGLSPHALDYWRNSLVDDNAENGPTNYPQHRLNEVIDELVNYGGYGDKYGHRVFEELKEAAPKLADEFIDVVSKQTIGGIDPTDPGSAVYRSLENNKGSKKASQALHAAGIPGIKYLDGNSRGQGEGTKNYVVFDPKIVGIKDRYAEGGFIHDPEKAKRRALIIARGLHKAAGGDVEEDDNKVVPHNLRQQIKQTDNPKRIIMPAQGPGGVNGIVVPRHMWEGGNGKHGHMDGMREINKARAQVYGEENRDPLTTGKIAEVHRNALNEHFKKPLSQQIVDEKAALNKLRAARHIGESADTLDESEKLDTVRHEHDDKGRTYVAFGSKGVAGHSVYTSGVGEEQKFHAINTCAGATTGCSGGVDENGFVDTKRGSCFAPNAEAQYPGAAIRRASHAQAKYDPAMTEDWVLAHTGSLRRAANIADKSNNVTLFRPNIVDESDRSSRYVIRHLNKQRAQEGKPNIIANSYSKTTELHDPINGYFVTYSNTGPKTKLGSSIAENMSRDKSRVRSTILATDASGNDLKNEDEEVTPPKNSYMVTDVGRYSNLDKNMQKAFTYAKYWSVGKPVSSLSDQEIKEGPEAHYDGSGEPTSPDNAHYGHVVLNDKRYDYQKQHILHPRLVQVGKNKDGSPHLIPTDSRFKDDDYLPKDRFMTKNGKRAGAILLTTPTTSTSSDGHQSSFTHHVDDSHIDHALKNNGEYQVDPPEQQESSVGKEYKPPQAAKTYAFGGVVGHDHDNNEGHAFPEQSFFAQMHNAHRSEEDYNAPSPHRNMYTYGGPVEGDIVRRALNLTRQDRR